MLKWIVLAALVAALLMGAKILRDRRRQAQRRISRDQHRAKSRATWDEMMELRDSNRPRNEP
jgi:hypothetical protein